MGKKDKGVAVATPAPQPMGGGTVRTLTPELATEFRAIAASDPDGLIQADSVVQRAEDPMSPLHQFFTWDDDKAANEWRLQQARYLIRSFRVELEPLVVTPVFVSLGENRANGGGYSWYAEVIPQTDLRRNLLLTVLGDIENLLRKIEDFDEVRELRQSISDARTKLLK